VKRKKKSSALWRLKLCAKDTKRERKLKLEGQGIERENEPA
jgi:hypothetical protein